LGGSANNESAADDAWQHLSPTPAQPGFFAGAVAQIKEELPLPTAAAAGAKVVHTIIQAVSAGESEWKKIASEAAPQAEVKKKPLIPTPVKEGAKFVGLLALAAASNVAGRLWKKKNNKGGNSSQVILYQGATRGEDVIDAETTEVKD
jgi:hypothetical protein